MEYFARKDFFWLFVFNILRRGSGEGAVEAAGLSPPKESRCKSGLQPRRGNSANRSPIPVAKAEGPDGAYIRRAEARRFHRRTAGTESENRNPNADVARSRLLTAKDQELSAKC